MYRFGRLAAAVLRCLTVKARRYGRPVRPASSDLELRQLRALVAVADHGSVTAAARALGIAQSTMSEALSALERALSAPLLQRRGGTRGAALTGPARALLPHAREVLAAVEGVHVALAAAVKTARGAIDIVANESISTYVLPRALTKARERWPNTRFQVSVAACPDVRAGVTGGTYDLGLLLEHRDGSVAPVPPRGSSRLFDRVVVAPQVELVAVASPSHPLLRTGRRIVAPRALAGLPIVISDAAGEFTALIERFLAGDDVPLRLQSSGSIEGVKEAVRIDARAVGILPAYAVRKELASGRIVRLQLRPALPAMRMTALCSTALERHPAIAELLEGIGVAFAGDRDAEPAVASSR